MRHVASALVVVSLFLISMGTAVAGVVGMESPYERLKDLTRGRRLTAEDIRRFIASLGLPDEVATRLSALTPATYTGLAAELVEHLTRD